MTRKPTVCHLLATHFRSTVAQFSGSRHSWPADDYGVSTRGYVNNLALGRLILDGQGSLSEFLFDGNGPSRGMYIDFIEFQNYATNFNEAIFVDPNLTIYFAGANVPVEKLNGAAGGSAGWYINSVMRSGTSTMKSACVSALHAPATLARALTVVFDSSATGIA